MESFEELIVDVEDGKVTFNCAFCSRQLTTRAKTFEKKPLCMSCVLRTVEFETAEESIFFLRKEYKFAKRVFKDKGLTLLETKGTFRPSTKSVCGCICGKKHKALLPDLLKEGYEACPTKRTRKGMNSSKEDEIRELFLSKGCEYIGPYTNNKTPTKYICSCGKEAEVKVQIIKDSWKGCRSCSYKARGDAMRK